MPPSRELRSSSGCRHAPYRRVASASCSAFSSRASSALTEVSQQEGLSGFESDSGPPTPATSMEEEPDASRSRQTRSVVNTRETRKALNDIIVIDGVELKPTVAFQKLWYWIAERKAIDDRRRSGQPAPWTKDPILRDYAFCNCYRVLDRVSQYIIAEVIEKGPQDSVEVVFRVTLFNLFTKTETWELLQDELGPLRWSTYDHDKYVAVLDEAKRQGVTLYTAAFQKFPHQFEKTHHHINHLFLLENMMTNEFPYKLTKAKNLADVYEYIVSYPGMGEFNTYQLLVNLSYTNVLNFHRNDFVVAGCGAISGLTKMFGSSFKSQYKEDKYFAETVLRWLTDHQGIYFERLGLEFSGLGPDRLPLDVSDMEHSACELDKYCRKAHPNIKGTSKSFTIKQVFKPKSPPSEPVLPKAWSHPKRRIPRIHHRPLKVEKRYEVNCIRGHKVDKEGNKLYHVFWVGYKDSEATWEFEASLLLDAPNAVKDYLASIKNKSR